MNDWVKLALIVFMAAAIGPCAAQNPYEGYGPQPMEAGPQPQPQPPQAFQPPQPQPQPQQAFQPPQPQPPPPQAFQPYNPQSAKVPWDLLNQARALIQENKAQSAMPLIADFIRLKPLEPEGYFWQGVALDNMSQTDAALGAYWTGIQQVLKAGMDSAELRLNAANDLLKKGRLDDALEQYRRAAQIDPGLPIVQLNLGRALIEKGDVEHALECFQRCEDLHFKPYQLSYYRAKALKKAGRLQDARAQALSALSQIPPGTPTSLNLKQEFADVLTSQ